MHIETEIKSFVMTKPVQPESEHGDVEIVVNPCITESSAQLQGENGAVTVTNPIGQLHSLSEDWETDTQTNNMKALIQMRSSNQDIETNGVKPYIITSHKNALWNGGRCDNYSIMTSPPLKIIPVAQLQTENRNVTIINPHVQLHSLSEDLKTDTKHLPKGQTLDQDIDAEDVKPYITECLVQSNCELSNREVDVKPYTAGSPAQFQSDNVDITTSNPLAQLHSWSEDLKTDTKHLPKQQTLDQDIDAENVKPCNVKCLVQSNCEFWNREMIGKPYTTGSPAQFRSDNGNITNSNPLVQQHNTDADLKTDIEPVYRVYSTDQDIEVKEVKPYITESLVPANVAVMDNDVDVKSYTTQSPAQLQSENLDITTMNPVGQLHILDGHLKFNTKPQKRVRNLFEDIGVEDVKPGPTKSLLGCVEEEMAFKVIRLDYKRKCESKMFYNEVKLQFVDMDIETDIKSFVITKPVQPESEHGDLEIVVNPCITESSAQLQCENGAVTVTNPIGQLHSLSEDWETDTQTNNMKALIQMRSSNQDIETDGVKPYIITSLVPSKNPLWNGGRYDNYSIVSSPPLKIIPLAQLQTENRNVTIINPHVQLHSLSEDLKTETKHLSKGETLDQDIDAEDVMPYITKYLVQSNCELLSRGVDVKPYTAGSPAQFQSDNVDITTTNPLPQLHSWSEDLKTDTKHLPKEQTLDQDIGIENVKSCNAKCLVQSNCQLWNREMNVKPYTTGSPAQFQSDNGNITNSNPLVQQHNTDADLKTDMEPVVSVYSTDQDIEVTEDKPYITESLVLANVAVMDHDVDVKSYTTQSPAQLQPQKRVRNLYKDIGLEDVKPSPTKSLLGCVEEISFKVPRLDSNKKCESKMIYNEIVWDTLSSECKSMNSTSVYVPRGSEDDFEVFNLELESLDKTSNEFNFQNVQYNINNFYNCPDITKHSILRNLQRKMYTCESGKTLVQNIDLSRHLAGHSQTGHVTSHLLFHSGEKPYSCDECGKKFTIKSHLTRHLLFHSGEKPYCCDECGKKFTLKSHLTRHLSIHSEQKPYSCDECGKSFTLNVQLTSHLLIHSGEKPYSCDECGKKFTIKRHLTRHLLIHSEEKPYSCDECGKSFTLNGQLTSHLLIHSGEKPYSCDECGKKCRRRSDMNSHLLIHSGEKPYSCDECGKKFTQRGEIISHLLTHSGEKPYSCDECGKKFTRKSDMTIHLLIHSGEKPYSCDECGKKFTIKSHLTSHLLIHSGEEPYSCDECGKKFTIKSHLTRHLLIHSGEEPYSCDECGKKFTIKSHLTRHLIIHSGEKPYSCDECGKSFTLNGQLTTHLLIHSGEKPYSCDECGKKFTIKSHLTRHLLIHSGEKPYCCDECGKTFTIKGNLTTHLLIHSGENPYSCDECGKKFTTKSHLTRHILIHSGEKPYCCDECGKKFTIKSNLTAHLLIHSGEKPYSCDECGKKFTQRRHLNRHLLIHSGEKPYSCDQCGKKFKQRGQITSHLLTHSGEKTHSCDECGKSFTLNGQLTRHLLIHLGEQPYCCDECGKKFTQRGHLKRHLIIHSGEKPYSCDECGKKFTQRGHLTSHLLIHSRGNLQL